MKIKFEVQPNIKVASNPTFTIFMENKTEENIELLITKFNLKQLELPDKNPIMQKSDEPITDGILTMNRPNLKKFIRALQLLDKS